MWGQPPAWVFTHQTRVGSGITWCHSSIASTERPQNLALHVPEGATWPRDPPRAGEAPPEGSAAGHEARTSDEGSLPSAQRGQGRPRSCGGNAGGWRRAGSGIWGRATRLEDTENSLCSSSPTTSSKGEEKPRHHKLLRGSPTPQSHAGHTASPSWHRGDPTEGRHPSIAAPSAPPAPKTSFFHPKPPFFTPMPSPYPLGSGRGSTTVAPRGILGRGQRGRPLPGMLSRLWGLSGRMPSQ